MPVLERPIMFAATANAPDARRFYEDILGLKFVSDEEYALVFDIGGIALRIQKLASIPAINHTVLGWEVMDIRNCVLELSSKGVAFEQFAHMDQDELGIWRAPGGGLIAWFKDPDGNMLSLTEHPAP